MPHITQTAIVPYTTEQMFDLVNAIEHYPLFLKGCSATSVKTSTPTRLEGTLTLNKYGLETTFTTENKLLKPKEIQLKLLDGPFKTLEGTWRFTPLSKGSEVTFDLEFEFENSLAALTLNTFIASLFGDIVNSFCLRAKDIYS